MRASGKTKKNEGHEAGGGRRTEEVDRFLQLDVAAVNNGDGEARRACRDERDACAHLASTDHSD